MPAGKEKLSPRVNDRVQMTAPLAPSTFEMPAKMASAPVNQEVLNPGYAVRMLPAESAATGKPAVNRTGVTTVVHCQIPEPFSFTTSTWLPVVVLVPTTKYKLPPATTHPPRSFALPT